MQRGVLNHFSVQHINKYPNSEIIVLMRVTVPTPFMKHADSSRAPPRHPPATVLTVFFAVSPLLKGGEAAVAKRTPWVSDSVKVHSHV